MREKIYDTTTHPLNMPKNARFCWWMIFLNIDFQRIYDHFFETPKSLFFALWHGYVAVWQFTLHSAMLPCPCACVDDTQQQHTGTRLLEALLSCGG